MKQQKFAGSEFDKPKAIFGGSLLKSSHAKTKRPLSSKLPIHLVLRAVQGGMRLPVRFGPINRAVSRTCKKHGVKVYEYANVGNHLHILIKIPHVRRWAAFIRELTGRIAQVAQGLLGPAKGADRFWKHRPFTRIIGGWRKAYRIVKEYIHLNFLEAQGIINRREVKTLADLRRLIPTD